jgi:trehalose-6-phosphate synthase
MFADQTVHALRLLQKDKPANVTPFIWIHDYHLMLMANWIRQVCIDVIIMERFTSQSLYY